MNAKCHELTTMMVGLLSINGTRDTPQNKVKCDPIIITHVTLHAINGVGGMHMTFIVRIYV
jgi:hypothetical protein